jgi:proton-translocating NADH-quinone oxidoreductase chain L
MLALIPLLPFAGFVVNAFLGKRLPKSVSGGVACLVMLASFAVSVLSVLNVHEPWSEVTLYRWMASGDLQIPLQFRLDHLSSLMILVVTGIGSLIHIYSTAYMHEETDSEYARYFSYLNLFAAFMLVLVLGSSFPVMFVGWEGVGLCSYLLIGFWFRKKSAADAGKKAFVVNRIGDFGFILGTLLIFTLFGTLDFQGVAAQVNTWPVEHSMGAVTIATLLLFLGATGKSAQIPLYTWLPDAMEGPTPVSALIHAATMVTAGVYMIGRNAVLFGHAPITLAVVAAIGVATALMAGTIGLVQNDIKRVLAYSTVSQLGYMFLAMGVGRRHFPSLYARILQGAALPRLGRGDSRAGGGAGHPQHGRPEEGAADHLLDVPDRRDRDRRRPAARRVLLEGRDPLAHLQRRPPGVVDHRHRHVVSDRDLHVPPRLPDVPRRAATFQRLCALRPLGAGPRTSDLGPRTRACAR